MREINIKLIIFSILWNLFTPPRLNGYPNLNITAMVCLHAQDSIHRWKWARLVTFLSLNYVQNVLSKVNLIYISRSRNILLCDSKPTYIVQACVCKNVCVCMGIHMVTFSWLPMIAVEQSWTYKNTSWLDCCILLWLREYNNIVWTVCKNCRYKQQYNLLLFVYLTFYDSKTGWMVFGFLLMMAPETP